LKTNAGGGLVNQGSFDRDDVRGQAVIRGVMRTIWAMTWLVTVKSS
jgi:hypothetical protein